MAYYVTGSDDGLPTDNSLGRKVGPLIDVETLKNVYLTGLNITDPNTGKELPDATYKTYIDSGVSMLAHYLDISITQIFNQVENKDYHVNDYSEWGFMQLNNYPVIAVRNIEMVYFRDSDGQPETLTEIPAQWVRLNPHDGIIRLVPNAQFAANLQIGRTGSYFPEILRSNLVPHLWRVTYDHGFKDGKIPHLINMAIAQIAAVQALIVGGNLVLGAGIASSSISLDGLSQSISTTQSAENSAYSATLKDYSDRLFGTRENDQFAILPILKNYYKGSDFNII